MSDRHWIYLSITSPSGKVLYACSECGFTSPAPTKFHTCDKYLLEMNQRMAGGKFPESAYEQ